MKGVAYSKISDRSTFLCVSGLGTWKAVYGLMPVRCWRFYSHVVAIAMRD